MEDLEMAFLTREQILTAQDLKKEKVEVPEWGGDLFVISLTGKERDKFEDSIFQTKGKKLERNFANLRAKLVSLTACDENGKLLFTPADINALGEKSAAALDRVFTISQKLSGLTKEDIDELVKNSESDQGDNSSLN